MYRVIQAQKANFTVTRMTGLLGVSRSGFYKWRAATLAGPSPAQQRRTMVDAKVKAFHDASDQVYGAPRILADLRDDGEVISRKTVAASMRRQELAGISPRQFTPVTTVIDLDAHRPKDLVGRRHSTAVSSTRFGHRTSPIWPPTRAGCIYARCATGATAGPGVGGRGPHAHRSGRVGAVDGSHHARAAAAGRVIFTPTEAPSTPPGNSPGSPAATSIRRQSVGRSGGVLGQRPGRNPSGAH